MKLDRNSNLDGMGKYALLNLRKLPYHLQSKDPNWLGLAAARTPEAIETGIVGEQDEFFVIKLKDAGAEAALIAYADKMAELGMAEWAQEVREMAKRAGPNHPLCKLPD